MESGATGTDADHPPRASVESSAEARAHPTAMKLATPDIHYLSDDVDAERTWHRNWRLFHAERDQLWWQVVATLVVVAYVGSLIFVHRPASGFSSFWDGWVANIAGIVPVAPIVIRIRRSTRLRGAWSALATGVVLYNLADVLYWIHDPNLKPLASPTPSAAPYLVSYAFFIAGVVLMTQDQYGRAHASVRLDGAVVGLSIASIAALFWFNRVLTVSGRPSQVVVDMAHPLLDLILLVVLASGLAPSRFRLNLASSLMMAGFALFLVGDTIFLNQQAATGTYQPGHLLAGTWVVALWLLGLAASAPEDRRASPRLAVGAVPSGFVGVPVVFASLSVMTLAIAVVVHSSKAAVFFAIAALCVVIVRMGLSVREVHSLEKASYLVARTDELTGLANRRSFIETADALLANREIPGQLGLIIIDLDEFKEINDSLGHSCGDDLLRVVGMRFSKRFGAHAHFARLGGDEFACLAVCDTFDQLVDLGNELSRVLSDPISLDGVVVRVSASIGIAVYPEHGRTQAELLRSADVAMYEAKRSHATICVYQSDFDVNSRQQLAMSDELRIAIGNDQLVVHYQMTKDLHTGDMHGVEALVRWNHPTRGLIYPDEFIPLAERVGLIVPLTRVVLRTALSEMARRDNNGHYLGLSVNISHLDLMDTSLPDFIATLLIEFGVNPQRLTLEVTESSLGENPMKTRQSIEQLRALGVRISIDDFGVGYSSMSQLLALPIDELKIDQTFVLALDHDVRARALITSAIDLGRALNVTVVAEGIETYLNYELLRTLGADIAQGYYVARPKTSAEIDDYLNVFGSLH